jgi:hypothetical protein
MLFLLAGLGEYVLYLTCVSALLHFANRFFLWLTFLTLEIQRRITDDLSTLPGGGKSPDSDNE